MLSPPPPSAETDQLFAQLYDELKRIAHRQLRAANMTLQTTGLVHEAYLKLAKVTVISVRIC